MEQYRKNPFKLYIQDIYRAKQSLLNKYVYEMFGVKFKNILLHGVITSTYNCSERSTNFELSDPTGCVQIYYDFRKSNKRIKPESMKDLITSFAKISHANDDGVDTMSLMLGKIEDKQNKSFIKVGQFVSVIGDIFIDDFKNSRMVAAYEVNCTSLERDILWLEDLRYLYEKHYFRKL